MKQLGRKRWDAIIERIPADESVAGAEIGVLRGQTASRVLLARPQATHIMIDPWRVPQAGSSYAKSGDCNSTKSQEEHEQAFLVTCDLVKFAGKRAIIMRMPSEEAAKEIRNGSLFYCFIDGDHSYEGVKRDIELWLPKIKKGGWIGGHDYDHPMLPGVKQAVDEAFEGVLELDANRTWFWRVV